MPVLGCRRRPQGCRRLAVRFALPVRTPSA